METPYRASADTYVIPTHLPVPGMGIVPVNCYLVQAEEPVLIDTLWPTERKQFLETLWSLIDPHDIKWIFLTHDDLDHAGNLKEVMVAAPQARLVTNYVSILRLYDFWQVPMDRVLCINPGQSFSAGDRQLTTLRPPVYDAPSSLGLYDGKTGVLFSSDSFGAVISEPVEDAAAVPEAAFIEGMQALTRVNSPWTALLDQKKFDMMLDQVRQLQPETILSTHGPAAYGRTESLLKALSAVPAMEPAVVPDQEALEAMMSRLAKGDQPS